MRADLGSKLTISTNLFISVVFNMNLVISHTGEVQKVNVLQSNWIQVVETVYSENKEVKSKSSGI